MSDLILPLKMQELESATAMVRLREGEGLWEKAVAVRPELELVGPMIRRARPDGKDWSPREAIGLDWLARAGAWVEGEPQTVTGMEQFLGVKPGWLSRLARRDHFKAGMAQARRLNRMMKLGARDRTMMERALNPEDRDAARFMSMWIEMDKEEESGNAMPVVPDGMSWKLTRERQVLEVMSWRPALEASVEQEIGGELQT